MKMKRLWIIIVLLLLSPGQSCGAEKESNWLSYGSPGYRANSDQEIQDKYDKIIEQNRLRRMADEIEFNNQRYRSETNQNMPDVDTYDFRIPTSDPHVVGRIGNTVFMSDGTTIIKY
jgi:hypothetical protein